MGYVGLRTARSNNALRVRYARTVFVLMQPVYKGDVAVCKTLIVLKASFAVRAAAAVLPSRKRLFVTME